MGIGLVLADKLLMNQAEGEPSRLPPAPCAAGLPAGGGLAQRGAAGAVGDDRVGEPTETGAGRPPAEAEAEAEAEEAEAEAEAGGEPGATDGGLFGDVGLVAAVAGLAFAAALPFPFPLPLPAGLAAGLPGGADSAAAGCFSASLSLCGGFDGGLCAGGEDEAVGTDDSSDAGAAPVDWGGGRVAATVAAGPSAAAPSLAAPTVAAPTLAAVVAPLGPTPLKPAPLETGPRIFSGKALAICTASVLCSDSRVLERYL